VLQFGSGAFADRDANDAWIWESGANYATYVLLPRVELTWYESLLYLTTPYLPLTEIGTDSPDAPVASGRSYGEWVWWAYLDEVVGAPELVRDLWTSDPSEENPLEVLVALMDERAIDFSTTFLDFAVHNATMDYSFGDAVGGYMEVSEHDVGGERIVATWDAAGTGGWQSPLEIYGLHRVSYNVVEVLAPGDQAWTVEVDTDDEAVLAAVVIPRDGAIERVDLADGRARILTTAEDSSLLLVVASTRTSATNETAVPYAYRLTPEPSGAEVSEAGCGCAAAPPPAPALGVLALVTLLARRSHSRRTA
jgi:MYXO-CTERM domain-containing protein